MAKRVGLVRTAPGCYGWACHLGSIITQLTMPCLIYTVMMTILQMQTMLCSSGVPHAVSGMLHPQAITAWPFALHQACLKVCD
jgi:hypothetical protein